MRRFGLVAFTLIVFVFLSGISLLARPNYLEALQADPMLRPSLVTGCGTCHVNPAGGGDRNRFGQAFEEQEDKVTPLLRAQNPIKFAYPVARIGEAAVVHFSDPNKKQVVIESGDKKFVVDVDVRQVDGQPATIVEPNQAEKIRDWIPLLSKEGWLRPLRKCCEATLSGADGVVVKNR